MGRRLPLVWIVISLACFGVFAAGVAKALVVAGNAKPTTDQLVVAIHNHCNLAGRHLNEVPVKVEKIGTDVRYTFEVTDSLGQHPYTVTVVDNKIDHGSCDPGSIVYGGFW